MARFLDGNIRKQAVKVEGRVSDLSPVVSGGPQGTVLGPILFLLHISDIGRGVSTETSTSSYVDDTRVKRAIKSMPSDSSQLQLDLQSIYNWASEVNMTFNSEKFEVIRYWPSGEKPDVNYLAPDNTKIEEKFELKDLGVKLSSNLSFTPHIDSTISGANRLIGMVLRTFRRRSKQIMVIIWKTILQPKLDYCSQLWCPADQTNITKLESVMRSFTSKITGCSDLDYWDRLKLLKLYSQERQRERY